MKCVSMLKKKPKGVRRIPDVYRRLYVYVFRGALSLIDVRLCRLRRREKGRRNID